MASEESVSQWIGQLKAGDPAAAEKLWERYFHRLVGLARKRLHNLPRLGADEEDVALSAFASFCRSAEAGKLPQLHDRDGLWRLLLTITARKAYDLVRDAHRQKRGGGAVLGESAVRADPNSSSSAEMGLDQVLGQEPTPELVAQMDEECTRLLGHLPNPELKSVAVWKMEGDTNEEIAAKLHCELSTTALVMRRPPSPKSGE
jgi:DNA-directed RNA polymerase specialized sigma24 family protein